MNVEILQAAEEELAEAISYYEGIEPGLGLRLKSEVRQVIEWIQLHPDSPRLRPKGYRRVNLKVFPYYVAYWVWNDTLWVLAIAHGYRHPEYWIRRRRSIG